MLKILNTKLRQLKVLTYILVSGLVRISLTFSLFDWWIPTSEILILTKGF